MTPLLEKPLEGPVYLRSAPENKSGLPDIVADLKGQIEIALNGKVDTVHGGLRTTFETVPDAPVTKFSLSLNGGTKGLLENSENLCQGTRSRRGAQGPKRAAPTAQSPFLRRHAAQTPAANRWARGGALNDDRDQGARDHAGQRR